MKTSTGWVTFMLYSSPATTWIGTSGRYCSTTDAVVRGLEVGVARRDLVGPADGGQLERLRGLAAAQPGAVRDLGDELAVLAVRARDDDRVRGRDGDVDGLVALQRASTQSSMTRWREQRADGVVEEDVAVLAVGQALAQGRDGALGGLVAGGAALDDRP